MNHFSIYDPEIKDIKLPDPVKIVGTFVGFIGTRVIISEETRWMMKMNHEKGYELEKGEKYKFTGDMETLSSFKITKIKKVNLIDLREKKEESLIPLL